MLTELLDRAWDVRITNHSLAEDIYSRCLAIDPNNAEALRELAMLIFIHRKDYFKALEMVVHSMEIEKSSDADLYYMIILNGIFDDLQDKFECHFDRCIKTIAEEYKGLIEDEYARFLALHGRFGEAIGYQQLAATRCPNLPYIQNRLSHLKKFISDNEIDISDSQSSAHYRHQQCQVPTDPAHRHERE